MVSLIMVDLVRKIIVDCVKFFICNISEGAPVFKWRGWSNGDKNQNRIKSVGLPTKLPKIPGPKINPKKSHAEFPSLKNFRTFHEMI